MPPYCPDEQDEKPQLRSEPSGYWVCLGCGQIFGRTYSRAITRWKNHLVENDDS